MGRVCNRRCARKHITRPNTKRYWNLQPGAEPGANKPDRLTAMDVVLDTNAVVSLGLTNPAFGSLRDYLRKTKSRLLIPEVVLEELRAQRRSAVSKSVRKGLEADKELVATVPGYRPVVKHLKGVDVEAAVDVHEADIKALADKVSTVENQQADSEGACSSARESYSPRVAGRRGGTGRPYLARGSQTRPKA